MNACVVMEILSVFFLASRDLAVHVYFEVSVFVCFWQAIFFIMLRSNMLLPQCLAVPFGFLFRLKAFIFVMVTPSFFEVTQPPCEHFTQMARPQVDERQSFGVIEIRVRDAKFPEILNGR